MFSFYGLGFPFFGVGGSSLSKCVDILELWYARRHVWMRLFWRRVHCWKHLYLDGSFACVRVGLYIFLIGSNCSI